MQKRGSGDGCASARWKHIPHGHICSAESQLGSCLKAEAPRTFNKLRVNLGSVKDGLEDDRQQILFAQACQAALLCSRLHNI